MPSAALKKFEMVDPARYDAPDPCTSVKGPKPFLRMHSPLSTFSSDSDRNTGRARQRVVAYCGAAVLEVSLLAVIWVLLARPPAQKPDNDSTAIEMVEVPPEQPPAPPVPQKIQLPTLKPMPVHPIPRLRMVVDRDLPIPAPQAALPNPPPPSPPPTPPQQASTEAVDRFAAQVRAAIQAAIVYPPTARMMKQQGRTKIAFKLIQGRAQDPSVVQSSGVQAIDTAAIAAVRDAAYPAVPPEMAGKPLAFAVFVEFNLSKS